MVQDRQSLKAAAHYNLTVRTMKKRALEGLLIVNLGLAAVACAVCVPGLPAPAAVGAAPAPGAARPALTVLDGSSPWRVLTSLDKPLVAGAAGPVEKKSDLRPMPLYPPNGWAAVEFDDTAWPRRHFWRKYYNGESDTRAGGDSGNPWVRQISLRGKFTVGDPQAVQGLKLTLVYRGGAAVYLNGTELARRNLPAGEIAPGGPAEAYPEKASMKAPGKPWHWYLDKDIATECYPLRIRRIENLAVPAKLLRKGVNVVAVEIHAAAYPEYFAKPKIEIPWATAGFCEFRLQGAGPEGLVANVVRPAGFQAWNVDMLEEIGDLDWPDPHETLLKPIRMTGVRNGVFSGRVMLSSDQPIENVRAVLSPLVAADGRKLPGSALRVRYGKFWEVAGSGPRDDALLEAAPQQAPVQALGRPHERGIDVRQREADGLPSELVPGAFQSLVVTATIPKDAAAATYQGTLTVAADSMEKSLAVPVEIKVLDWTLPDPKDFAFFYGLIESPEGVAYGCNVPLWSERHWEFVGKSLSWVGQTGGKVLWLNLLSKTEYGNAESLVRWVKGTDGKYTYDYSRLSKYVELAVRQMGKPTYVVCTLWAVPYQENWAWWKKTPPLVTAVDPATGTVADMPVPYPDSPEAPAFWKPVMDGVKQILDKHGLGGRMLVGSASEAVPNKASVGMFRQILPEAAWERHCHPGREGEWLEYQGGKVPVLYSVNIWGAWDNDDPAVRRVYGWKFPYPVEGGTRCWLNRDLHDYHSSPSFRIHAEQNLLANRPGGGQLGADFWAPAARDGSVSPDSINCRYPRTQDAGSGGRSCTMTLLLYPSREGPVATLRYEATRENIQECEARIFLEKLLSAEPCPLPAGLAKQCQDVLDTRTRWHRVLSAWQTIDLNSTRHVADVWAYSGWQDRSADLYRCAAAAAKAVAGK
jgi:hypothetical protein